MRRFDYSAKSPMSEDVNSDTIVKSGGPVFRI
jgi:hypothetical protein